MKFFLFAILFIYSTICILAYIFQRNILYFPTQYAKIKAIEEIYFDIDSIKLQGWVLNKGKEKALIYYGGNAENIEQNIDSFLKDFPGRTIYLINYRGYGRSEGLPTEKDLFNDALKIYANIQKNHKSISLIGKSLGSGIASYVASKKNIEKLVLITPYDSILNVAKEAYPFLPVSFLLKDKYESIKYIPQIKTKSMIIYGGKDTIINPKRTENLIKQFKKGQVKTVLISKAGHNNISLFEEYNYSLRDFFNKKDIN
ncbi:MAG: alpha/beta hydrolase [Arcobacter sp.]|nr:MAG: alpha/beta hydrolase [Arcobacter sp.]